MPRIYADFQNLDDSNRIRLTCAGTREDLARQGVQLRDGLNLTLYTDDEDDAGRPDELLVDGTVQYNDTEKCWVAAVNWNHLVHASERRSEESHHSDSVTTDR
ncbi:MAG: hypothetical protein ACREJB_11025 [Planctomycetaceae bacterium]